jgi:hypothetical protein
MSTRSMIFVKINKEDQGKTVAPNKEMIYAKGLGFGDVDSSNAIPEEEIDKVPAVKLDDKYIGIYHHWDGYPEGVGDTLTRRFNTYEDALNLLLYGDESSINSSVCIIPYILRGCGYKKKEDTPPNLYNKILSNLGETNWAEYVYLFKDGEWYFDTASYSKTKRYRWKKVKAYLESRRGE